MDIVRRILARWGVNEGMPRIGPAVPMLLHVLGVSDCHVCRPGKDV